MFQSLKQNEEDPLLTTFQCQILPSGKKICPSTCACTFKVKSWYVISIDVRGIRRNMPWRWDWWKPQIIVLKQFPLQFLNYYNIIFQQACNLHNIINYTLLHIFNSTTFNPMWEVKDASCAHNNKMAFNKIKAIPIPRKLIGS